MSSRSIEPNASIIALDKFILATRDSGYKGTASALAELVDNSLQAGARRIALKIESGLGDELETTVTILDDGSGMDPFTLRQALRFGGSSRFNDRAGLGRYGMGLPNSSLSQARRVEVHTWQKPGQVFTTHLDVDEIATGVISEVPVPRRADAPPSVGSQPHGTLVTWRKCDRLDNKRVSTLTRKLAAQLGQTFRFFLWDGVVLSVNDEPVRPIDPLFLQRTEAGPAARRFGEILEYEVCANPTDSASKVGHVLVTFSELPVHDWSALDNEQKRALGISKGAGVSVVRGKREVDYGWFFMGAKRREIYDDWFRCQVEFDPVLDEAFGITHTKQQIRPQQFVIDILSPDIEKLAHALNSRVRKSYGKIASSARAAGSEQLASQRSSRLRPLPQKAMQATSDLAETLKGRHASLRTSKAAQDGPSYRIIEDQLAASEFFDNAIVDGKVVLVLNQSHPFYRRVYKPLLEAEGEQAKVIRTGIDMLLLAAARSASALTSKATDQVLLRFRREWGETLATFLND